ncbi:MAG: SelB C-terminal domain-containing protein [Fimbriimonadaceae bacterium]|nr:SelB C-terminal domain-containing protein [Fimbriimonadaceae bacterium]
MSRFASPMGPSRAAVLDFIGKHPEGVMTEAICERFRVSPPQLGDVLEMLRDSRAVMGFAGMWIATPDFRTASARLLAGIQALHDANPTELGVIPDEAAQHAGLPWDGKPLDRVMTELESRGDVVKFDAIVRLTGFAPPLNARQRQLLDRVVTAIESEPISAPTVFEVAQMLGVPKQAVQEMVRLGVYAGELRAANEDLFYTPRQLSAIRDRLRAEFSNRRFEAADAKTVLEVTRKHLLPLLQLLDAEGLTAKTGDERRVK